MKLVRDKIPEIIEKSGSWALCRSIYGRDEHLDFLKLKMIEEVDEFLDDPCLEEAADIYEVFRQLLILNNLVFEDVVYAATNKRHEKGGFSNGVILQEVGKNKD